MNAFDALPADAPAPALDVIRQSPYNAETPDAALVAPVTPAANVYVRTNFAVPLLDDTHVIEIGGAVHAPFRLGVAELRTMPQHSITMTMECAGNDRLAMHPLPDGEPWKRGAVSTASWTGVPLRTLLERATLAADAVELLVRASDHGPRDDADGPVTFARSVPVHDALHPDTLLALSMNGEPLSAMHGAPVRLVVPGWYGMASVKWVTAIEAIRAPFEGYFQRQRYVYDVAGVITPVDRMRVKSIITTPADGARCDPVLMVRGWAWSGHGAITRVEVGVDGGDRWREATVGEPVSAHAWTPWECMVELRAQSRVSLRCRATDASGAVQPDVIEWNRLGYGNNAVRTVVVDVR